MTGQIDAVAAADILLVYGDVLQHYNIAVLEIRSLIFKFYIANCCSYIFSKLN